jgi:hypothetical protein
MPNWGGGAVGAASGAGIGSMILPGIGTGIGAGIGGLLGLFRGKDDEQKKDEEVDPYTKALQDASLKKSQQGEELVSKGSGGLNQVMAYLQKLASGDPSAVMDATKQARGRVIDQYDSAKRSVANFTPRGGGGAAAMGDLETGKANQLSDILSSKQDEAVGQLSQTSQALTGLGLSAEQLASTDLSTLINTILAQKSLDLTKRGQNIEGAVGAGEGIGTLIGLLLTRNKGKAA